MRKLIIDWSQQNYELPDNTQIKLLLAKKAAEFRDTVINTLDVNKECFVVVWMLQNPDANIKDYTLCYQNDWSDGGVMRMWMEKR